MLPLAGLVLRIINHYLIEFLPKPIDIFRILCHSKTKRFPKYRYQAHWASTLCIAHYTLPCRTIHPEQLILGIRQDTMKTIEEKYQRTTNSSHSFDIRFWQSQGDRAIFEAVSDMLHDYFLIRGEDANEFRLQRTAESFQKA